MSCRTRSMDLEAKGIGAGIVCVRGGQPASELGMTLGGAGLELVGEGAKMGVEEPDEDHEPGRHELPARMAGKPDDGGSDVVCTQSKPGGRPQTAPSGALTDMQAKLSTRAARIDRRDPDTHGSSLPTQGFAEAAHAELAG